MRTAVAAALERAAASKLRDWVLLHRERALAEAEALERLPSPAGPLHGVPVGIKDNIDEAGVVCAAGCRAYRDRVPTEDAAVVTRLRAAGAVIIGRTAMQELADGVTSDNPWTGPVQNPHRAGFSPGGSSGGSAAAVASGSVPVALGTDTGGSVRIPASLCGVVGLKPTRGLVSTAGVVPLSTTLDHVGPITRTVAVARRTLEVLCHASGPPGPVELASVRLGVVEGFAVDASPEVAAVFLDAVRHLERAGATVLPVSVEGLHRAVRVLADLYPLEASEWHAQILAERPGDISELVRADLARGDAGRRRAARAEAEVLRERMAAAMEGLSALACPTTPTPAQPHNAEDTWTWLTHTAPFNLTGQPAISVPMGSVDGLPVGLQLAGHPGHDHALLALAEAWEQSLNGRWQTADGG